MLWNKLSGARTSAAEIVFVGGYTQGFVGDTLDITISLTSLTGGIASAPAANDFVVVYYGTGASDARALSISGYTQAALLYANDLYDANLLVAYKRMGATPDTSLVLTGGTLNVAEAGAVSILVWRNVNATTPMDVTPVTVTGINSSLCNPSAITPITSGAYIVAGGSAGYSATTAYIFTSPDLTGFISSGGNDSYDVAVGAGYKQWTSGAFDPGAFSITGNSTNNSWAAVTLALRPA